MPTTTSARSRATRRRARRSGSPGSSGPEHAVRMMPDDVRDRRDRPARTAPEPRRPAPRPRPADDLRRDPGRDGGLRGERRPPRSGSSSATRTSCASTGSRSRPSTTDVLGGEIGYVISRDAYYLPEIDFTPAEITALFVAAQSGTAAAGASTGGPQAPVRGRGRHPVGRRRRPAGRGRGRRRRDRRGRRGRGGVASPGHVRLPQRPGGRPRPGRGRLRRRLPAAATGTWWAPTANATRSGRSACRGAPRPSSTPARASAPPEGFQRDRSRAGWAVGGRRAGSRRGGVRGRGRRARALAVHGRGNGSIATPEGRVVLSLPMADEEAMASLAAPVRPRRRGPRPAEPAGRGSVTALRALAEVADA